MKSADALAIAREWIDAWNAHDLERVLSHYSDDFEMSSPYISQLAGEPSGTLKGKARVGEYWSKALARFPHLRFDLEAVHQGVHSLALYYRSTVSGTVVEVLTFDELGKIVRGHAYNVLPV